MSDNNSEKKHVLVISSDPRILAEIKMELLTYFSVSISASSSPALNALKTYPISAVVICIVENSDMAFSDFHDIFEVVKEKHIPILFIAEQGNDHDETTAFAVGAVDYSARRRGTSEALVNRIRLRIHASEHERLIMEGERFSPTPDEVSAEEVLKGKTFLVVDDVSLNRDLIRAMLSGINGLDVHTACDGREAFEMFKAKPNKYSLILMDIQMPEMDGFEATMAIRALSFENAKKVPIIALTAASKESEVKKCIEAGMDDFIVKPMAYEDLIIIAAEYCK